MNSLVDNIYVINMKKDVKRLNKFKQQCDHLFKYEIIEGVDVRSDKYEIFYNTWKEKVHDSTTYDTFDWTYYLNRYEDLRNAGINNKKSAWEHYVSHGRKELRSCNLNCDIVHLGQLGCLLSHINIIKDAINKHYGSILILEDDIIVSSSFKDRLSEIKDLMKNDFKILYLGVSQHDWNEIDIEKNVYTAINTTGAFAYIIHHSFYQTLLDEYKKLVKPVDNYLVELQQLYDMKVLYPNIIYSDLEDSNMSMYRANNVWFKKFRWLYDKP